LKLALCLRRGTHTRAIFPCDASISRLKCISSAKEHRPRAHTPRNSRTDSASRIIKASPQKIFQAFVDPWAWESWLPPKSMKGRVHVFDFRAGGRYRMELTYLTPDHATKGKTSEHS